VVKESDRKDIFIVFYKP